MTFQRRVMSLLAGAMVGFVAAAPVNATDVTAGMELAKKHCARCHAIAPGETSGHKQAPAFTEVVTRYPPSDLAEALAEGIVTGHPDMPEFVFPPEQIEALIVYLESLQQ